MVSYTVGKAEAAVGPLPLLLGIPFVPEGEVTVVVLALSLPGHVGERRARHPDSPIPSL